MTSESLDRLREMQRQIEFDAAGTLSRAELVRLRQYWGDIQTVLDNEPASE